MIFPLTLLITTAIVFILRKPLKKRPLLFYLPALLLSGLYLYANYVDVSVYRWSWLLVIVQRCGVALSLFALVMFAGVFSKGSRPRAILYPLRSQLAIIGSFLASGHIIVYASTYIPQLFSGENRPGLNIVGSIVISFVIAMFLVVLTATSFVAVRRLIEPLRWKRVQTLAYPFFLLIFVHLALLLLPAAAAGSGTVIVNLIVYAALFGFYIILRLRRARNDKEISTSGPI
jgi:DMSO/TMAO reductase YedYZ heme-binding membrane subunit